jgi:hypothetical protein
MCSMTHEHMHIGVCSDILWIWTLRLPKLKYYLEGHEPLVVGFDDTIATVVVQRSGSEQQPFNVYSLFTADVAKRTCEEPTQKSINLHSILQQARVSSKLPHNSLEPKNL